MELLKHVAKHHVNEKREVKNMKGKGEEVVHEGEIECTEKKEKMDDIEEDKSFVFSESQFFNEFL